MSNTFKVFAICIIFLLVLLLVMPAIMFLRLYELQEQDTKKQLETEIMLLEAENAQLREMLGILQGEQGELKQQMKDWLDAWEVQAVEITGYAPLDARAVEGMCYSGDPNVTASGEKTTPGLTVAAGPDIPFGTRVYVEGAMRIVQDRGGRIENGNLDLLVWTQEEAFEIGRREAMAIIEKGADQ